MVEVEIARGKTVVESVKKIGVTEQTYYRQKKKFGGMAIVTAPCPRRPGDFLGTTPPQILGCVFWTNPSFARVSA